MANKLFNPRLSYLTDEVINTFTGNNVLTDWRTTNEMVKKDMKTINGGVLDSYIFGSCFSHRCNCGKIHAIGRTCKKCGAKVLTDEQAWTKYARIDLPLYFCNDLRKKKFSKFMSNNFNLDWNLSDEFSELLKSMPFLRWDYCQFTYDENRDCIIGTDQVTNSDQCSFESLIDIISTHYPQKFGKFKSYLNSSILVIPIIARAPRYVIENGVVVLKNHEITLAYSSILYVIIEQYDKALLSFKLPCDQALYKASVREFICTALHNVSRLLVPNKENVTRLMQSHHMPNSGRCTIIPAPDLKVDEIYIPRHLMYECCQKEFIKFLMTKHEWSEEYAQLMYLNEATTVEIQADFDDYIENSNDGKGKYVIINRNPTLYELSIMACKVKLTNNYTIGLPLLLCSPFGGDYDGDTFSFYAIPDYLTDEIIEVMSPKNLYYYKKSHSHLFTPSHEIMAGLIISTRISYPKDGKIRSFGTIDDAKKWRKTHRDFTYQTKCFIDDKETTLGRAILGELFNRDIDEFLNGDKENLTSKEIPMLYDGLVELEDRLERIQQIQEFALNVATISGGTAPRLSELHAHLDTTYLDEIKTIEASEFLTDKEKDIKIREIYDKFSKDVEQGKDEEGNPRLANELKLQISDSSRAKISQLLNIVTPQLNVGPDGVVHVGETTLIGGMRPTDYYRHAIENRVTQDIKTSSVPRSGYTTRQLVYLGTPYRFSDSLDEKNKGIELELYKCSGRTRLDGSVITQDEAKSANKTEMVTVRSIVTATHPELNVVTKDMISRDFEWKEGANVGISLLSSLTEGLTQSGLSLKHGGRLFETDKNAAIRCPKNGCHLSITETYVVLTSPSGREYLYPKTDNFVQNYNNTGIYQKDEVVGVSYRLFTPSYRLDSVIKLLGAQSTNSRKTILNNKVMISECYAYSDGVIKYEKVGDKIVGVKIGDKEYSYNPSACYFIPEGTEIKKGQRFCTGTMDLDAAIRKTKSYKDVFYLFYHQFNELISGMAPELIEFVFSLVVSYKNGNITHKTVRAAIMDSPGTFNKLAFRDTKKTLESIDTQGLEFVGDSVSRMLLPSVMLINLYE